MATADIKEKQGRSSSASRTPSSGGAALAERPQAAAPAVEVARPANPVRPAPAVAKTAPDTDRFRPRAQNWGTASTERHQMGSRRPKGLGRAKVISRRSPEAAAVAITSFVVTLLCLYVAAYARVTAEGFEKERLMDSLREARAEEDALHGEVSRLKMPDALRARAKLLGLVPGEAPTMNLVTPSADTTSAAAPADTVKEQP